MAGDETLQKRLDDSDSDAEDDDVADDIPKVEIDPSKLTPLSPEVISKQASLQKQIQEINNADIHIRPQSILVRVTFSWTEFVSMSLPLRYYWPCRTWKINRGEGYIWSDDSSL